MTGSVVRLSLRARISWLIGVVLLIFIVLLALFLAYPFSTAHPTHPTSTQVIVNAQQKLGTLSTISAGLNTAIFDTHLLDASTGTAIKNAGVGLLRYPGGLDSDLYHWQSNTLLKGPIDPKDTFDAFMQVAQDANAQAMITVDYGAGTPAEAAGWVQYANRGGSNYSGPVPTYAGGSSTGHTYGIQYWEIGNEVYGDGTYGVTWENNDYARGPLAYARGVKADSQAMKAVDPTVKIGAVLTAPGNWPDGNTSSPSRLPWNQTVLSTACTSIDFVVVHWYAQNPGNESDATLLASTGQIANMMATARAEIQQACGAHASAIQIMLTETNSVSYNPGKQTVSPVNALFLADNYMTWLEQGVANVDWWDLHDSPFPMFNNSSSLDGNARFGEYGLLASGTCAGSLCESALNTPFPPYYALQLLGDLGRAGDTMVESTSDQILITPHAVRQANGDLALLLINKDPTTSSLVSITLQGYTAGASVKMYMYGENQTAITSRSDVSLPVRLAPYSLAVLVFSPFAASTQGSMGTAL